MSPKNRNKNTPARQPGSGSVFRHEHLQVESRAIPSPAEMAQYNDLMPNAADRFMGQWERESAHRQALELFQAETIREDLRATNFDRRLGLVFGWLIGMTSLAALVYLAVIGAPWWKMGAVVTAAAALVWAVRRSTTDRRRTPRQNA